MLAEGAANKGGEDVLMAGAEVRIEEMDEGEGVKEGGDAEEVGEEVVAEEEEDGFEGDESDEDEAVAGLLGTASGAAEVARGAE